MTHAGMAKEPFMVGVAAGLFALTAREKQLMREAGIRWLRSGNLGFDIKSFLRQEPQPDSFGAVKAKIAGLRAEGFHIIGITPSPREIIGWEGVPGTRAYHEAYRRLCASLAREYKGLIDVWQVANELDIWIFRDALSLEQSVDFLKAGVEGVKSANSGLKVGINITLFPSQPGVVDGNTDRHEGVFIAKGIYQAPGVEVDYAGFDSYPGTWREGGAESWSGYLDAFHELTGKPIIIQEFGYSSAGGMMTPEETLRGAYPCEVKKWRFAWHGAHSPQIQADFIEESLRVFAMKPYVMGALYYRWKDSATCWQCGKPDCPAETAWGLLDQHGNLNPSYHRFKESVGKYVA